MNRVNVNLYNYSKKLVNLHNYTRIDVGHFIKYCINSTLFSITNIQGYPKKKIYFTSLNTTLSILPTHFTTHPTS